MVKSGGSGADRGPGGWVLPVIGQREHPLARRHPRQQVVDEGGRVLGHPPPLQLEQKPRRLHEKGTSRSNAHSGHRSRVKPSARIPQRRKSRNSCSEHGVLGVTRPIRGVGMRHALA